MCKPIFCVVTWLICISFSYTIFVCSTDYILSYYFSEGLFKYSEIDSETLNYLEVESVILAGSGLFLIYLQFNVKFLLCLWITVFILLEIEIFVVILLDAGGKFSVRSIIHLFHASFVVYSLVLVIRKCRNLKYCSLKDSTCQVGLEEQGP